MYRNALMMSALLLAIATAANAQVSPFPPRTGPLYQGPTSPHIPPEPVFDRQYRPTRLETEQIIRWGDIGKCVAAENRDASLAYVTAKRRSPQAAAAAKRLDPVFDACLAGSGILAKSNKAYRRAAVADALGVRLSS